MRISVVPGRKEENDKTTETNQMQILYSLVLLDWINYWKG